MKLLLNLRDVAGEKWYNRYHIAIIPLSELRRNPVALPKLTDEQRKEALAKAAEARKARAELKEKLKRGGTNLKEVLDQAESNETIGKTKVSAILEAMPKVGKVKAKEIMDELEIAQTRRLRGLGDRQRRALLERFGFADED
ncbi:mIHF family protein [Corynebacterium durum F0235]|jgi:hypothetical protein|uniref:MIHF family protein n=1 Tax=Corynebacterium durum F0235 TaxID=1035195 RepID=L1MGF2_9CORY|nr:mIHF family protein [Corynebacterium durum F0235]